MAQSSKCTDMHDLFPVLIISVFLFVLFLLGSLLLKTKLCMRSCSTGLLTAILCHFIAGDSTCGEQRACCLQPASWIPDQLRTHEFIWERNHPALSVNWDYTFPTGCISCSHVGRKHLTTEVQRRRPGHNVKKETWLQRNVMVGRWSGKMDSATANCRRLLPIPITSH